MSTVADILARLAESPRFIVAFEVLGTAGTALAAGWVASAISAWWPIVILVPIAFVAAHYAFGTFEMQLLTGLIVISSVAIGPAVPWFTAVLGAFAGFMAAGAILKIMDQPNLERARKEASRQDAV